MTVEFLRQVARHYLADGPMSRLCFVFPNKRAVSFFKKYLGEEVAAAGHAVLAPQCFTMNDFFYSISGGHKTDRIKQLLLLYDCYAALNPKAEPLDEFLYWGGVMLSDFNDADKYLAPADKLWKNVQEFKAMHDLSFLDEGQREAISEFLGHFDSETGMKEAFLQIWNLLLPLYRSFNEALRSEGLSYEGQIYRELAEELDVKSVADILSKSFEPDCRFVFAGLNALNECERKLLVKMRNAGLAEFCWDFSSAEIKDPENKASFFMTKNLELFPQAFEIDPGGIEKPEVNVLSVPSAVGQAKQIPEILRRLGPPHDIRTAIVLPDEGLLLSLLGSIPSDISELNVTMGYPMKGSQWMGLLSLIGALQCNLRETPSGTAFYHRQVWALFSNSVFRACLDEEARECVEKVRSEARFFIPKEALAKGEFLSAVFRKAEDKAEYLKAIILIISHTIRSKGELSMELEFAMHSFKLLTRLQELSPKVEEKTWWKLLLQLLAGEAVPFSGEPLKGMQIMGPLETRALDFENLIILSCNEGMFPRRAVASSFIPAELRRGFGLPTYEYQDAIWAYYFYRSIQRARKVWLLFDSRSEMSRSGEESRYVKQLSLLYGFEVKRYVAKSPIQGLAVPGSIPKTAEDIAVMDSPAFSLSASSVRDYLYCQALFYYSKIKRLSEPDEVEEALDAGMLGSVLHGVMHALYSVYPDEPDENKLVPRKEIEQNYLKALIKDEDGLHSRIRERIGLELKNPDELSGRNLVYEEIIFRYVKQILSRDLELLVQRGQESFRIIGLEKFMRGEICGFPFNAFLDRIDSIDAGKIRIVDYKTGRVLDEELDINDENAGKILEKLFGNDNGKRPGIALQLYVYDRLMAGEADGKILVNSIYQCQRLFVEGVREQELSATFRKEMEPLLLGKLSELKNPELPWLRTDKAADCEYCKFKIICGR